MIAPRKVKFEAKKKENENIEFRTFLLPGLIHLPQKLRELPQGLGAEHQIHVGIGLFDPLRHPGLLGHAAAQADHLLRVFLFCVGETAQIAEDPLFRVLTDGAGIQNHQIRLLGVLCKGKAAVGQHPHQLLAVRHVLLTAEGVHAGHRMGFPGSEHFLDLCFKLPLTRQRVLGHQYIFSLQMVYPPKVI